MSDEVEATLHKDEYVFAKDDLPKISWEPRQGDGWD